MNIFHVRTISPANFPGGYPHNHALAHWTADIKNGGVRFARASGGEATVGTPNARRNE